MPERHVDAYPHQLSGGMRQRAMIAMALACQPILLIADEPTTALDVTTQAQILDLMLRLKREMGMGILMITHDLGVIAEIAERVVVMYLGRAVEVADVRTLFHDAKHPYTQALLQSIPKVGRRARARLQPVAGMIPSPYNRPHGCLFHPRCPLAIHGQCDVDEPPLQAVGPGHNVACWLYGGTSPAYAATPHCRAAQTARHPTFSEVFPGAPRPAAAGHRQCPRGRRRQLFYL